MMEFEHLIENTFCSHDENNTDTDDDGADGADGDGGSIHYTLYIDNSRE